MVDGELGTYLVKSEVYWVVIEPSKASVTFEIGKAATVATRAEAPRSFEILTILVYSGYKRMR